MIKRLRWMTIGAVLGVAGYLYVTRRAKEAIPDASRDAMASLRELGLRVREAIAEGRIAMREKETELRRELLPGR